MKLSDEEIEKLCEQLCGCKMAGICEFTEGYRAAESRLLPLIEGQWRKYDPKDDATWPKDEQMIIGHYRDHGLLAVKFFAVNGSVTGLLFWQPAPEPPKIDPDDEAYRKALETLAPDGDRVTAFAKGWTAGITHGRGAK